MGEPFTALFSYEVRQTDPKLMEQQTSEGESILISPAKSVRFAPSTIKEFDSNSPIATEESKGFEFEQKRMIGHDDPDNFASNTDESINLAGIDGIELIQINTNKKKKGIKRKYEPDEEESKVSYQEEDKVSYQLEEESKVDYQEEES